MRGTLAGPPKSSAVSLADGFAATPNAAASSARERPLPPAEQRYQPLFIVGVEAVLDVGGVYAEWLAAHGHRVRLVNPVALHVEQTGSRLGITATVGDARSLDAPDASADVVLLLGQLYHLADQRDPGRALAEAGRVLRPGGLLFAAAISRYAALLDLLVRLDRLHEPDLAARVKETVASGVFRGDAEGLFTTAYLYLPADPSAEVSGAGFDPVEVFNIEGPGFLVADFAGGWADPGRKEAMLTAARLVEREPVMMAAANHLLDVGQPLNREREQRAPEGASLRNIGDWPDKTTRASRASSKGPRCR